MSKESDAALDVLHPELSGICIAGESRLDAYEKRIAELRGWAKGLDRPIRIGYEHWLDFYERDLIRRRREIAEGEERRAYMERGDFPRPPKRFT